MTDPGPPDRDATAPSIPDLEAALRQRPVNLEQLAKYVKALVSANRWQDVLNVIGLVRQGAPDLADSRVLLLLKAEGLIVLNRYTEALEVLSQMAELGFKGSPEMLLYGTALNALGRYTEALPSLELAAARLEPEVSMNTLFVQRLVALNGVGRPQEALDVARHAEASWPAEEPQGLLLWQKAIAFNASGHPGEALEAIEHAQKSWPEGVPVPTGGILFQTAFALNALNEPGRALAALEQLEALPNQGLPQGVLAFQRGVAELKLGRPEQSITTFAQVCNVPPDMEGMAAALMGQTLFNLNRFDEAEAPLTRAVALAEKLPPTMAGDIAYLLGLLELRAGRPEHAVSRLEMAVRLAPTLVKASNDLVFVLLRLGRLDEARRANEAALARASDAPGRAQAWLVSARIEMYEGHTQLALDALRCAAQENPQVERASETVVMEANLLLSLGQPDRAMERLNQAVADIPESRALLEIARANILMQRGDLDRAFQTLAEVTELSDPSSADEPLRLVKVFAHLGLGNARRAAHLVDEITDPYVKLTGDYWVAKAMIFTMVGQAAEALEAADRALGIVGLHAYAVRFCRAQTLVELGRYQDAIDEFDRALIDAPTFVPAHVGKGFALMRQERFSEALVEFRTAKAAAVDDNNRVAAAVGEGLALVSLGEHEEGLRVLKGNTRTSEALPARVPYRGLAWWTLGTVYAARQQDEEALDALVRASRLEPNNTRIQIDQGCIYARLEEFDAALRCFQNAGTIAEEDGEKTRALIGQGGALVQLDRHDEAVAAYRAALVLEPENATVWQALAEAYGADGRHGAALQAFRRAYRLSRSGPSGRRPSAAAVGVSAQLLALEKNHDAWQFLDKARHEAESDPKLDFNRGLALTRLRRYRDAIEAFRAARDVAGSADQVEALEARRSRGRSWLDMWFGADASLPSRIGGASILAFIALLMGLMLLNPKEVPALAWVNTADAWKAMGVLVLILLLPSVGRLKWGEVQIESLPVEVLPEIHLSPSEPRSALEILVRSAGVTQFGGSGPVSVQLAAHQARGEAVDAGGNQIFATANLTVTKLNGTARH